MSLDICAPGGTCLVSVARNCYSVPCELAGQMVSTQLYPSGVAMVAHDKVVSHHERLGSEGQTRYDWQHYIPLLQLLQPAWPEPGSSKGSR